VKNDGLKMTDADGNEIKLYTGINALKALSLIESLDLDFVADDDGE